MRKLFYLSVFCLFLLLAPHVSAQMMGNGNYMMGLSGTPTVTPTQEDLADIKTGQDLYTKFLQKQLSCTSLKDADFEKIGEYLMNQKFGSAGIHIQANERIKQMMGNQGEEQMHIAIARNVTGCSTNNQQGGGKYMMGWNGFGMMNWGGAGFSGFWIAGILVHIVIIVDLILLGMWLWKQVKKK